MVLSQLRIKNTTLETSEKVITAIVLVHNLIIFAYHSYTICVHKKRKILPVEWVSLFALLLIIFFSICLNLYLHTFYSILWCEWLMSFLSISYSFSKLSLYYFFLEKLFLIFLSPNCSQFRPFKKYQIYISRICMILFAILIIILFLGTGSTYIIDNHCEKEYPFFTLIIMVFGDLTISITVSVLFSRRLKSIESHYNHNNNNNNNNNASNINSYLLLKKYMLLSLIAIISTQCGLIIMAIFIGLGPMWNSIDMLINSWCILLTFRKNRFLYQLTCGKLHHCIGNKCLSCYTCSYCCSIHHIQHQNSNNGKHNNGQILSKTDNVSTNDVTTTRKADTFVIISNAVGCNHGNHKIKTPDCIEIITVNKNDKTNTTNTTTTNMTLPKLNKSVTDLDITETVKNIVRI